MPHLAVIQLMRVIKWPRSDSDGSCVNKKGRGYKGFYSIKNVSRYHWVNPFKLRGPGKPTLDKESENTKNQARDTVSFLGDCCHQ